VNAAKIAHRTLRQDVNSDYTHLQMPFTALRESFADRRFLVAALALNSVIVPPVTFALSQLAPAGRAVELGVLMVLLTPCIDYLIVLTRLAGGSDPKPLAAPPLLMLTPTQACAFAIARTRRRRVRPRLDR
jgi:ACR3 family arsenite efflux pump ArsB